MRRFIALAIGCGLTFAAASVIAATPGTPFGGDDAGFIPSDSPKGPITKCENTVGKAVAKLAGSVLKCHCSEATGKLVGDSAEEPCASSEVIMLSC